MLLHSIVSKPSCLMAWSLNPPLPYQLPISHYRYNNQKHLKVLLLDGLYGFSEEMCIHRTLMDLVLHYSENSLKIYNKMLTTTLEYPVKADT